MACAGSLSSVRAGLVGTDRGARDLARDSGEDQIPFEFQTTLFERLSRNHKSRDAGFHIGGAETENLTVANRAAELARRLQFGAKHPVLFCTGEARVHMPVDLKRGAGTIAFDDAHGVDSVWIDLLPYRFDS